METPDHLQHTGHHTHCHYQARHREAVSAGTIGQTAQRQSWHRPQGKTRISGEPYHQFPGEQRATKDPQACRTGSRQQACANHFPEQVQESKGQSTPARIASRPMRGERNQPKPGDQSPRARHLRRRGRHGIACRQPTRQQAETKADSRSHNDIARVQLNRCDRGGKVQGIDGIRQHVDCSNCE